MPNTTNNQNNPALNNTSDKASSNPGNFKNDPQRAAQAGQKGGQASKGSRSSNPSSSNSSR